MADLCMMWNRLSYNTIMQEVYKMNTINNQSNQNENPSAQTSNTPTTAKELNERLQCKSVITTKSASPLLDKLLKSLKQDTISELVSSAHDKCDNVISLTNEGLVYMSGLQSGLRFVNCEDSMRLVLANLGAFTNLQSVYLSNLDMPLFIEQWPVNLQIVSLLGKYDPEPLNGLYNVRKLGLFQTDLDLTKLNILAPQLQELAFISTVDESILSWFGNLEWLTYGVHKGNLNPLSGLKRLKHLFIEDYQCSTLEGIQGCSRLTHIRIQSNTLQDISAIKENESLVEASFISTGEAIKSIEALSCSNLRVLNIPYSGVLDFTPLQTISNLETLRLDGCLIDDLSVLEGLNNLQVLGLEDIPAAEIPDFFKPLLNLPNLRKVYVSRKHTKYLPRNLSPDIVVCPAPYNFKSPKSKNALTCDMDNIPMDGTLTDLDIEEILSQFN